MISCSRCGRKLSARDKNCPSCGLSTTTSIKEINNVNSGTYSKTPMVAQNQAKAIVVVIAITIFTFVISVLMAFREYSAINNNDHSPIPEYISSEYSYIESAFTDVFEVVNPLLAVLEYTVTNPQSINKEMIQSLSHLDVEDMTISECVGIDFDSTEEDVKKCYVIATLDRYATAKTSLINLMGMANYISYTINQENETSILLYELHEILSKILDSAKNIENIDYRTFKSDCEKYTNELQQYAERIAKLQ